MVARALTDVSTVKAPSDPPPPLPAAALALLDCVRLPPVFEALGLLDPVALSGDEPDDDEPLGGGWLIETE
jgi:hypothetical protein